MRVSAGFGFSGFGFGVGFLPMVHLGARSLKSISKNLCILDESIFPQVAILLGISCPSLVEMAADWVRCGYPRVSVFRVSGLVLVFRPRFSGSGLGLVSGSVLGFGFHPWISNGYPK